MGLAFALNHGLNQQHSPIGISGSKWIGYKKAARTLVTLRRQEILCAKLLLRPLLTVSLSWLVATLGYMPGDNFGFQSAVMPNNLYKSLGFN